MCRSCKVFVAVAAMAVSSSVITGGAAGAPASAGTIERVSVGSAGEQGDGASDRGAISADGRFVAFESFASNLVAGDTDVMWDVFVRDRETGTTSRVSVSSDERQVVGASTVAGAAISPDGRFVAFHSDATNLVPGDTNGIMDVFVRDRRAGTTERVSVGAGGVEGNRFSAEPAISADGRFVAFESIATTLVPGDTNETFDVFVRDRETRATTRVSVASGGEQTESGASDAPAISADGRFVAFESFASNLVAGDTNLASDVFVHDRATGTTSRVSVSTGGGQSNGETFDASISADGRFVAFSSLATNLSAGVDTNQVFDVFVHDRATGTTRLVSVSSDGERAAGGRVPSISADGRSVAFESFATDLVAGDTNACVDTLCTDVFVHDRATGTTSRVSVRGDGQEASDTSFAAAISADGRSVAFTSNAANLVAGDTNAARDVFVHDDGGTSRPTCGGRAATVRGTAVGETLVGTAGPDVITGLGGADTIRGRGGRDVVCGGAGADVVSGGGARDRLLGGAGADEIHAEQGDDRLLGGADGDTLFGDRDNDRLAGGLGDDRLVGGLGTDTVDGGTGTDTCRNGETVINCE